MNILELIILAISISIDCFVVAIACSLQAKKNFYKGVKFLVVIPTLMQGAIFFLGYKSANIFSGLVENYATLFSTTLLILISLHFFIDGFKKEKKICSLEFNLKKSLSLAFTVSIDAFATGCTLSILKTSLLTAIIFIFIATFILSLIGLIIGLYLNKKIKIFPLEFIAGILILFLALKINLENYYL